MAIIVLRSIKGSPLTIAEADANFTNLNTEVGQKLDASEYTAADVLTKLLTVDGAGSGLDADTVDGHSTATTNTASTVVVRDASGNFSAGTITASLTGNVTGNVTGNLTGTVTGNASNVSGIIAIGNGGTGATTAENARTGLGLGTIATQAASNVSITGGSITDINDLLVADGGTGASTASQARANLGVSIGSDVQPFSNELTGIAAATNTGFYVRTGSATVTQRTFTVGTNGLTISNGSGVSGNPSIDISSSANISITSLTTSGAISVPSITKTGTNGSGDIGQTGNRFATIYGTSTSAQYADLAEKYTTDKEYEVGTVIVISLDNQGAEGTASFNIGQRVLGVVSEKPAFLMNDDAPGQALALRGRVPVKISGPVKKGDEIISAADGRGIVGEGKVFAIALHTDLNEGVKLVECVILS